jgi:hypothetical protein
VPLVRPRPRPMPAVERREGRSRDDEGVREVVSLRGDIEPDGEEGVPRGDRAEREEEGVWDPELVSGLGLEVPLLWIRSEGKRLQRGGWSCWVSLKARRRDGCWRALKSRRSAWRLLGAHAEMRDREVAVGNGRVRR